MAKTNVGRKVPVDRSKGVDESSQDEPLAVVFKRKELVRSRLENVDRNPLPPTVEVQYNSSTPFAEDDSEKDNTAVPQPTRRPRRASLHQR